SLPVKKHLEACLESGFSDARKPLASHDVKNFRWLCEPFQRMGWSVGDGRTEGGSVIGDWLAKRSLSPVQTALAKERLAFNGPASLAVVILDFPSDDQLLGKTIASLEQ